MVHRENGISNTLKRINTAQFFTHAAYSSIAVEAGSSEGKRDLNSSVLRILFLGDTRLIMATSVSGCALSGELGGLYFSSAIRLQTKTSRACKTIYCLKLLQVMEL